jgi:hypothetical protein
MTKRFYKNGHYNKGRKVSEETRKKLSEANKSQIPWHKGKKCPQLSGEKTVDGKVITSKIKHFMTMLTHINLTP